MKMFKPILLAVVMVLSLCACSTPTTVALRGGVYLYVTAPENKVYVVEKFKGGTGSNWVFATNFIGNGTNAPPELIGYVADDETKFFRITPE